jgi:hypothetical protein
MPEVKYCQCYKSIKEKDKCCPHPAKPGSKFCGLHSKCPLKENCAGTRPSGKRGPSEYHQLLSKRNEELKKGGVKDYKDRRHRISGQWVETKAKRTPLPQVGDDQLIDDRQLWQWKDDKY